MLPKFLSYKKYTADQIEEIASDEFCDTYIQKKTLVVVSETKNMATFKPIPYGDETFWMLDEDFD